jgi:hypothetical protein
VRRTTLLRRESRPVDWTPLPPSARLPQLEHASAVALRRAHSTCGPQSCSQRPRRCTPSSAAWRAASTWYQFGIPKADSVRYRCCALLTLMQRNRPSKTTHSASQPDGTQCTRRASNPTVGLLSRPALPEPAARSTRPRARGGPPAAEPALLPENVRARRTRARDPLPCRPMPERPASCCPAPE